MASILITGGTGLVGKELSKSLEKKGHQILILSRNKSTNPNHYYWNIDKNYIDSNAIIKANYIIHLAGAGIADSRWTSKRKKILLESRVKSANLLFEKVKEFNPNLKGFISASGIGFYGAITSNKIFSEQDESGDDFISNICTEWENSALKFNSLNIRTVILRTGIVLSAQNGALEKICKPIKLGLGSFLGTGKQFMPWIHIDDLCAMFEYSIENENIYGIYNAVAPQHISNQEITLELANHFKKKIWIPNVPSFILKFILGEMSIILLKGSRVSAAKILKSGFMYRFPKLHQALKDLL